MPAGALLGAKVAAYWDPAIAITLSLWVVRVWGGQAQQHLLNLVGRAAPPDLLQRLTYLAFYHDERVQKIDTVRWVQASKMGRGVSAWCSLRHLPCLAKLPTHIQATHWLCA